MDVNQKLEVLNTVARLHNEATFQVIEMYKVLEKRVAFLEQLLLEDGEAK